MLPDGYVQSVGFTWNVLYRLRLLDSPDIVFYFFVDINPFFLRPEKYNIIEHNCNNFTNDVSQFLTGNTIPSYITGLPRELLDT